MEIAGRDGFKFSCDFRCPMVCVTKLLKLHQVLICQTKMGLWHESTLLPRSENIRGQSMCDESALRKLCCAPIANVISGGKLEFLGLVVL